MPTRFGGMHKKRQTTIDMSTIDKDFCLDLRNNRLSVSSSNIALRLYSSLFEDAVKLSGELPIVVDANILLGYYGMSQAEKEKLVKFFTEFSDRIILTKQVEREYLKNRLSVIKKDFFTPLNRITDDYLKVTSDIEGLIKNFGDSKKKLLSQDYPELWEKVREIEEEIKAVMNDEKFLIDIQTKVSETTQNNKNIVLIDNLLDIISKFKIAPELTVEEETFLRELYNNLIEVYKSSKESIKWQYAIPGCGEGKDDPLGDFFIFHEILKYMKDNQTSCIFLTNDVTKGDWLQVDKNPHNHFIEHSYLLTNQVVIIIHAEQTLPSISFENIHKEVVVEKIDEQNVVSLKVDEKESSIVNLDKGKGFGFIYNKGGNLYFSYTDVLDKAFEQLEKNDRVRYSVGLNQEGKPIAVNIKKINYSFEDGNFEILTDKVTHINHLRGIGFISHQPENLYFHQAFFENESEFETLKVGDEVSFIIGKNSEGEEIAGLIRKK